MSSDELNVHEQSTEEAARARVDRFRAGIRSYLETMAEVSLAWERRDWAALGYADWAAYVNGEYGAERCSSPSPWWCSCARRWAGTAHRTGRPL
ncbi:hypothetical protein ACIBF5_09635 [Micromonospora sp. NPDC050417]|uniref:hypothetical protein n=1 Tax=Micromonospora sp. NPDC050417 TaxID=3364280 RepID=UPI0037977EF2